MFNLTYDKQEQVLQQMGAMLLKEVWGDVAPVSWMRAVYSSMASADMYGTWFCVVFYIEPHLREVAGYRQWMQPGEVVARIFISDRDRHLVRDIQSFLWIVKDRIQRALTDSGALLYEHDPRIGFLFDHHEAVLPRCPLFTPRGPPWRPKWEHYTSPPPVRETGCLLCGSDFKLAETPMWGGANVGWTHIECWGEGLPRMPYR